MGANDYFTKPFTWGLMRASAWPNGRCKRRGRKARARVRLRLVSDYEKRKVYVDNHEIHLTPTEYKTLLLLIANKGKVLTHNYIIRQIWGYEGGDSKSVRVFMANLRRKLGPDTAHPRFILTDVGVGYRFADQ